MFTNVLIAVALAQAQVYGPGVGPWSTATPESEGLKTATLAAAETAVSKAASGRKCFLVVKKGKIVYEKYYSSSITSTNEAYSTTKSLCSSLFGIGVQQGWANVNTLVAGSVSSTRSCKAAATYKNVLTMTGMSSNMASPKFSYDLDGTTCYNVLATFVQEKNSAKLTSSNFFQTYMYKALGYEHMTWAASGSPATLPCGTGSKQSCRDLARGAQLWLNRGTWKNADGSANQIMSSSYITDGAKWVYPTAGGDPYGYGVRTFNNPTDPVDPAVSYFGGVNVQCAFFSKKHEAVVVTMGFAFLKNCKTQIWDAVRSSIVSTAEAEALNMTAPFPAGQVVEA